MTTRAIAAAVLALLACQLHAQGMDSTPAERQLRILAEMLPGHYSNANQAYFDVRRQLPETARHGMLEISIAAATDYTGNGRAFNWRERGQEAQLVLSTSADDPTGIRAEFALRDGTSWRIDPARTLRIVRTAGSFSGKTASGGGIQISARELWLDGGNGDPYWLERSRGFHCYADVPGVGGGRDIPFQRYDDIRLHDQGGEYWFTTRDADQRQLGLRLTRVNWHVLNEANGNFNRNSLVLYLSERMADGSTKEHGYAFTDPDADRIGLNLKWMLANCAITPRQLARPEM
ncbi:MAG: hypothetical protein QG595_2070 [Pseudomonadota bacterium]|nr:hypothetical protein [Pseudomonadota bacterium]